MTILFYEMKHCIILIYLLVYYLACSTSSISCKAQITKTYEVNRLNHIVFQTMISYCDGYIIHSIYHENTRSHPTYETPIEGWIRDHPSKIFRYSHLWGYMEKENLPLLYTVLSICTMSLFLFHLLIIDSISRRQVEY